MRAGAVGISLTAATHVFLLEPAMNPKLEDQAVGRAWRLGLTHPVTVTRFYVKARPPRNRPGCVMLRDVNAGTGDWGSPYIRCT